MLKTNTSIPLIQKVSSLVPGKDYNDDCCFNTIDNDKGVLDSLVIADFLMKEEGNYYLTKDGLELWIDLGLQK